MRSNVLTAGQIPKVCEVVKIRGSKPLPPCGKAPVVATVDGWLHRLEDREDRILVRWYICGRCALEHSRHDEVYVVNLTDYELEVAS